MSNRRPFDLDTGLEPWAKVWRETPRLKPLKMLNLEIVDGELFEITADQATMALRGRLGSD